MRISKEAKHDSNESHRHNVGKKSQIETDTHCVISVIKCSKQGKATGSDGNQRVTVLAGGGHWTA